MAARIDVEINAKGAKKGGKEAENALNGVGRSARRSDKSVLSFNKSLLITAGFAAFAAGMAASTRASIQFKDALAEVSTLLDDTPGQLDQISAAALRQAVTFGSMPVEQTKAFYQIISAGAADATEATITLTAANKLAVGGVTTVTVAADGLTSILNAYGVEAGTATNVSDALFVAMRAGKTDIEQLSRNIGNVAPLASTAGVALGDLLAATAALTKGGVKTSVAMQGIRAIIAAIIKPSSEAATEAKRLEIAFNATVTEAERIDFSFNAAGLKAKGFAVFLDELKTVTGGNVASIAKLFGGVEALSPVLDLTGKAAKSFADILSDMLRKAGETEKAFTKMSKSPGFQIKRTLALIAVIAIRAGDKLSSVLAPALELVVDNIEDIEKIVTIVGVSIMVAFGPAMAQMIGTTLVFALVAAKNAVLGLNVSLSVNPWVFAATAIAATLTALMVYEDEVKNFIFGERETVKALDDSTEAQDENTESIIESAKAKIAANEVAKKRTFLLQVLFDSLTDEIALLDLGSDATAKQIEKKQIALSLQSKGIKLNAGESELLHALIGDKYDLITALEQEKIAEENNAKAKITASEAVEKRATSLKSLFDSLSNEITLLELGNDATAKQIEQKKISLSLQGEGINLNSIESELLQGMINDKYHLITASELQRKSDEANARAIEDIISAEEQRSSSVQAATQAIEDEIAILALGENASQSAIDLMRIEQSLRLQGINLSQIERDELQKLIDLKNKLSPPKPPPPPEPLTFDEGFDEQLAKMVESSETASARMGKHFASVFGTGGTLQKGIADATAKAIVFGDSFEQMLQQIGQQILVQLISKLIQTGIQMVTVGATAKTMAATTTTAIIAGNTTTTAAGLVSQKVLAANTVIANKAITVAAAPAAITTTIATSGGSSVAGAAAFAVAMVAMLALVAKANGLVAFAKGGAFTNQVVTSPTAFPIGLMGEAGPEAILPLSRNSSGQLGVIAAVPAGNNGGVVFAPVISVNIENATAENSAEIGSQVGGEIEGRLNIMFSNYLRKQQRPGGQLNRQRRF